MPRWASPIELFSNSSLRPHLTYIYMGLLTEGPPYYNYPKPISHYSKWILKLSNCECTSVMTTWPCVVLCLPCKMLHTNESSSLFCSCVDDKGCMLLLEANRSSWNGCQFLLLTGRFLWSLSLPYFSISSLSSAVSVKQSSPCDLYVRHRLIFRLLPT